MKINYLILKILSPVYAKYLKYVLDYEKNNFLNHSKIESQKLENILKHCIDSVPFYKNLINKNTDIRLENFPLINKEVIRNNFDDFIASNIDKQRMNPNSTSGSTGSSFHFFSDKETDNNRHAFVNLGEKWAGAGFGKKMFLLWGAERDLINKGLKSKLINSKLLFNIQKKSSYHLTDTDIVNDILPSILKFDPKIIVGYPSTIKYLANYIINNNVKPNKSLNGIITSGEALNKDQREVIEKAFKVKVFNRYGCRDVGPIAHECEKHNGMHVFSSHVYVEILNEKGEQCKPGELGQIVVTDLDNYVFPFVRYKIGDLGKWSKEKCCCGRDLPLLESVEGRTFDLIIGTNGNKVPGTFFTLLKNVFNNIEQFQLEQEKIGVIELKLKLKNNFIDEEKLKTVLREKLGLDMKINIKYVDKFNLTKTGKFKWVISKVNLYE